MNFAKTTFGGTYEILASNDFQAIPIKVATPGSGTVVKQGTPLTAAGESTTGSGAIGILLYDVDTAKNPNAAIVVQGIIDSTKAQALSEVSYASALYEALPGIVFRTGICAQGGESGGSGDT